MLDVLLGACGLAFLACSFYVFLFDTTQREVVLDRLRLRRRRATNSLTPPRSLSPEKQESALDKASPTADYSDVFPPSRRYVLAELPANALKGPGESAQELGAKDADYLKRVPSCEATDIDDLLHHTTPTGFTVSEVKRLGDFPDYAALSGVPLPEPYHAFDISKALPRPYRPFRWAYYQTMSLTKLEPDWWLELEHTYADRIRQREQLFEEFGPLMLQALPGSEIATKELMEMCLQFLCARYPQCFRLDLENMVFHNLILQTEADLRTMDPLHVLLHNIPEDFAIMLRDPETGIYSFRAGIICSSLGWNLGSKIGLKLHEIHAPIPDYKEKMQFSMDRYFSKKPTEKAIQRGSWGLEIDEPLFMPPDDPHEKLREVQDPTHTIDRCHLRVDWQTLRRLPLSGAVVFNFKAVFTPVTEFRDEPYVPALILKVLKESKKSLMEYKNTWHTEHVVIPALEEYQREQVAKGLVEEGWEPYTLEESPFYPGWEEKWHRRQGF
ncbi:hypothetical protein LTR91_002731 [Friedmanniomyces endolithicus]|uniref:Alpha-1,2-mannosyltransferase n=1 Tax=Friedmanniomyces endolithicus TaxID=329885 RepID=A0AAN6KXI2_9PEZI|nr:hypothetical protein LTR35_006435 [Friedmanniomyces endolithicus]KAK0298625.1 hypothetical protein LTS00_003007 [Friedmanniomyces endolithicus]KAK0328180.1 hypothetical protein LTR82_000108 [Friedmanniomyces endolithicus]KAK0916948.1 hypothetical protein LTR57_012670 [Friedmanniomyces endolithicus]KAK0988018.1 hypothetical protein LTS01_009347 [Friedmanniomyces endolithicus]